MLRARRDAGRHVLDQQDALVRDEDVVRDDRLAAGPLEPHRVPVVHDLEVGAGHQEPAAVGGAVVVGGLHRRGQPVSMIDPAGEEPLAGPAVAALHAGRLPDRVDARRDQRRGRRIAEDRRLDLLRKLRDHPEVRRPEGVDPARRGARLAEDRRHLQDGVVVQLGAAHRAGDQEQQQAALQQLADRLVGQAAAGLGHGHALAEARGKLPRPRDRVVHADVERSSGRRLGHASHMSRTVTAVDGSQRIPRTLGRAAMMFEYALNTRQYAASSR